MIGPRAVSLWHLLQQVAGKVHPAALPDAALQLPADRLGEAAVGIRDHQLDATQAPLLEVGDELCSEGLALTVAHLEAQQLTAPVLVHPHGNGVCVVTDCSRSRRRWSKPWKLPTRWKRAKDKTRSQCYQASIKMGNK